ncbi:MAG: hypothetical protein GDA68_04675 [Nitrospira sp. CR2.1]|nr:hypothetical protein [Nitrospira sp. CR2.1]
MLTKTILVTAVCFTLGISSLSFGEDRSSQVSPELRKDLADMYQKMADCLRMGKPAEDCQRDIAKDCPVIAKTGQCPLQEGMGHMGMGQMQGGRGSHSEGRGPMSGPHEMR